MVHFTYPCQIDNKEKPIATNVLFIGEHWFCIFLKKRSGRVGYDTDGISHKNDPADYVNATAV